MTDDDLHPVPRCRFEPPGPVAGPVRSFVWLTEQRGTDHLYAGFEGD